MSPSKSNTARQIAAFVLTKADPKRRDVTRVLAEFHKKTGEPQRATDLVLGVTKNQFLINAVIERICEVPVKRISPRVLSILRVAFYELIYCPLTPQYAIVSQAVEDAKDIAGRKQAGFVNAVLRNCTRRIEARQAPLESSPVRRIIPQNLLTGCLFDFDFLADPQKTPGAYFADAFSLPRWLVDCWLETYGPEQTRQICFACNRRPSLYLRPNSLKTTVDELADKLRAGDVQCEIVPQMDILKVHSPGQVSVLPGFSEGFFSVQDISASSVVRFLSPEENWSILDLCAAPGTKTTHLAEAAGARAKIVATDIDSGRLDLVRENVTRLGLADFITVAEFDKIDDLNRRNDGFDCVFVDAPCSNTGVMAKRVEVRHRLEQSALERLADAQFRLLQKAGELLKPAGIICYSTCSILPRENQQIIGRFLDKQKSFKLKAECLTVPSAGHFDHDGGFVALLERQGGLE